MPGTPTMELAVSGLYAMSHQSQKINLHGFAIASVLEKNYVLIVLECSRVLKIGNLMLIGLEHKLRAIPPLSLSPSA